MNSALTFGKLDRVLLSIYLIALLGLLIFPVAGPEFQMFGIGADKWMHAALFGGCGILFRWNLSASRHPLLMSIGVASVIAAGTEAAQALIVYRSAELWDLLAGLLGAALGAACMSRILSFQLPEGSVGLLVAILGLMVSAFFAMADMIGVGEYDVFGTLQIAGTALGALISMGGVVVYARGFGDVSPSK